MIRFSKKQRRLKRKNNNIINEDECANLLRMSFEYKVKCMKSDRIYVRRRYHGFPCRGVLGRRARRHLRIRMESMKTILFLTDVTERDIIPLGLRFQATDRWNVCYRQTFLAETTVIPRNEYQRRLRLCNVEDKDKKKLTTEM